MLEKAKNRKRPGISDLRIEKPYSRKKFQGFSNTSRAHSTKNNLVSVKEFKETQKEKLNVLTNIEIINIDKTDDLDLEIRRLADNDSISRHESITPSPSITTFREDISQSNVSKRSKINTVKIRSKFKKSTL